MKPAEMTDAALLEEIARAVFRIRMAEAGDLRRVGDVLAGLALEAGQRLRKPAAAPNAIDVWGVIRDRPGAVPCLFGARQDAEENCDDDERVGIFRVQEIEPIYLAPSSPSAGGRCGS